MRVRLTPTLVRQAKPGPSRVYLWDTEVPGLGLVIHPKGTRSWVFQGTGSAGRRVTLGASGLTEARKAAIGISAGFIPVERARREPVAPDALTVAKLLDKWLEALAARPSPPVSLPRIHACIDNHVRPRVGKLAFTALERADVLLIRDTLAASGRRGMANQVIAYIRAALRWAEDARVIPEAPKWRLPRLKLGSRAHAMTDDQWARLMEVLWDPSPGLHPVGRLALLALALTGCRKGEITGLRWCDVGPDGSLHLVRHKTSARSGPKDVPGHSALLSVVSLARQTVAEAVDRQPTLRMKEALRASPYVFPTTSRNGMGKPIGRGLDDTWAKVRQRVGLPVTMTIHGLRSSFITQAQRLGVPLATVAALVGHESPMTTLRSYTAPTRMEVAESAQRMAEWISANRRL
ncbi:integrase family protein [Roseomonas gilardii]|uniref:tyrosine-type recombinase/integrase n=1 Tax=Roseomonas gilardii TaxID=257708 RepID=UPI00119D1121